MNIDQVKLLNEMKERCLKKGQYIDVNAKEKFKLLCYLEDCVIQREELEKENKILKQQLLEEKNIKNNVCNIIDEMIENGYEIDGIQYLATGRKSEFGARGLVLQSILQSNK